ncbi:MAG: exonuclease SbcCD subunit D [Nitrososphaerota archaeon]|nr:exonuclease SbcCD subunit D [Nitrososphaerota archaeon]
MFRFAHISDIHLGAFREPVLRELEMSALNETVERCIELSVDFVLISGDVFHVGIPDLTVVNDSIKAFRKLQEAKIPLYVIYGSHDYTPNGTSIIDILETAGILTNVTKMRADEEGFVLLDFVTDPKTGAKLTGISARRVGLESKIYEKLDKARLEHEKGFKIFAFHSGITELKPTFLNDMETIPVSCFPKNFHYYAGGHIHKKGEFSLPGYPKIVFPGPLFTGYGKDIEDTAKGTKRGFYLVSFDEQLSDAKFVPIKAVDGEFFEYDATGKNSHEAARELSLSLDKLEVNGKMVIVRLKGELSGGKTSDFETAEMGRKLSSNGAIYVQFNRFSLTTKEYEGNRMSGEDIPTVEANFFRENIGTVKVTQPNLKGKEGATCAVELLKSLRQQQKVGETKTNYEERVAKSGIETLKLSKEFEEE